MKKDESFAKTSTHQNTHIYRQRIVEKGTIRGKFLLSRKVEQDGNVPSRCHILGSKIFKEQLLEKFGKNFFSKKILIFFSKKSIF